LMTLVTISRESPNYYVTTKHNKTNKKECRNKCYGKVFHVILGARSGQHHTEVIDLNHN
jgi:hypothetical protein